MIQPEVRCRRPLAASDGAASDRSTVSESIGIRATARTSGQKGRRRRGPALRRCPLRRAVRSRLSCPAITRTGQRRSRVKSLAVGNCRRSGLHRSFEPPCEFGPVDHYPGIKSPPDLLEPRLPGRRTRFAARRLSSPRPPVTRRPTGVAARRALTAALTALTGIEINSDCVEGRRFP
jgi:hypothetical protein